MLGGNSEIAGIVGGAGLPEIKEYHESDGRSQSRNSRVNSRAGNQPKASTPVWSIGSVNT
jgi:hypothetical protein